MKQIWKRVKPWIHPIGLTLLFFILHKYILLVGYVPTPSMEPTLPENSIIIGCRIFSDLKQGDIVVFEQDGLLMVKRIAACPGDQVDRRKLKYMKTVPIPAFEETIITVPENCYFVLGDNSDNSWDSRYWKYPYVLKDAIVAKIILH